MTNPINQISINGETTTFLNFANTVLMAGDYDRDNFSDLLTSHLGVQGILWNNSTGQLGDTAFRLRFPTPWETLTGDVSQATTNNIGNARIGFNLFNVAGFYSPGINTTNGTGSNRIQFDGLNSPNRLFAVINNYSVVGVFSTPTRELSNFFYAGWLKDGQFVGSQFPRNCIWYSNVSLGGGTTNSRKMRPLEENLTTFRVLLEENPTLDCQSFTADADSTDVIVRDSVYPNLYVGKMWNVMVLPGSAVTGNIYKNLGVDPDTGIVETDQKAYWLCCGVWGSGKLGMRVWTDGVA